MRRRRPAARRARAGPPGLCLAAYLLGGYFTEREAVGELRRRQFEVDFLMLIAAAYFMHCGYTASGGLNMLFPYLSQNARDE